MKKELTELTKEELIKEIDIDKYLPIGVTEIVSSDAKGVDEAAKKTPYSTISNIPNSCLIIQNILKPPLETQRENCQLQRYGTHILG